MPQGLRFLPGVLAVWLAAVLAIGIGGDFPLSDDWAYAHAARSLCEGRGLELLPWTGASLVLQAIYGAAACKIAGGSYETFRLTTLALSAAGIAVFFALLRELGARPAVAAAGALSLALSPIWLNLSFTFMTEVPFGTLALLSVWLYVRGLRSGSRAWLVAASVAAAAAFLVRQHGIFVAAAAALVVLLPRAGRDTGAADADAAPGDRNGRIADAVAAFALPLVVAALYSLWAASDAAPLALRNKIGEATGVSVVTMLDAKFRAVATLGFLLLPWAAALRLDRTGRRVFVVAATLLGGVAIFAWLHGGAAMFYLTNLLADSTVGPLTTRDTQFLGRPLGPELGAAWTLVLTAASLASAAALVAALVSVVWSAAPRILRDRAATFCFVALALSFGGSLLQAHYYFDRYLIVVAPLFVAVLVAARVPLVFGVPSAALLAALSLYAVAGTHDWLAWNRARWSLLTGLEASGVPADRIDGGFEYNAERLAARLATSPSDAEARRGQAATSKSWWWVVDDEWVVAFGQLDGYGEASSQAWSRWLPPRPERMVLLRRTTAADADASPPIPRALPADRE
jgi:hypothetical protein